MIIVDYDLLHFPTFEVLEFGVRYAGNYIYSANLLMYRISRDVSSEHLQAVARVSNPTVFSVISVRIWCSIS